MSFKIFTHIEYFKNITLIKIIHYDSYVIVNNFNQGYIFLKYSMWINILKDIEQCK